MALSGGKVGRRRHSLTTWVCEGVYVWEALEHCCLRHCRMKIMIYRRALGSKRSPESNTRCRAGNCARQIIFFVYLCAEQRRFWSMQKMTRRIRVGKNTREPATWKKDAAGHFAISNWPLGLVCALLILDGVLYRYSNFFPVCACSFEPRVEDAA